MSETPNVLPHLNSLLDTWRRQNFELNKTQKEEYDMLLSTRRERVKELYSQGRVNKARSKILTDY